MRPFRLLVAWVAASALVAVAWGQSVSAVEVSSGGASGFGRALVVPGMQSLIGGEQAAAQLASERANPVAVAAREASRTRFEGLDAHGAAALANRTFATAVDAPAGGLPALGSGERIAGFESDHAAILTLPGGVHGVVESIAPIATQQSNGRRVPIDLRPQEVAGSFQPVVPASGVSLRIPKHLSSGVSLASGSVSLTPIDGRGRPVSGAEGRLLGASVFYGATAPDAAVAVKPTTLGFDLHTFLYSAQAPQRFSFLVGMPAGASLRFDRSSGAIGVVDGASTLARILPSSAQDATGAEVPVSSVISGNVLTVNVMHRAGSYLYPIDLDPEVNDTQLATTSGGKRTNWEPKSSNEARFGHNMVYEGAGKERLETFGIAEYVGTEWAYWGYETKGNSKIFELKTKSSGKNKGAKIESVLVFATAGSNENRKELSTETVEPEYSEKPVTICGWNSSKVEECLPGGGKEKNGVRFEQLATGSPGANYKFSDTLTEGIVSISEPAGTHSTSSFNTGSAEVEGEIEVEGKKVKQKRTNALYGAGSWLTKYQGALEPIAKDPGIGVSATKFEYESSAGKWETLSEHNYLEKENGCQGVQCYSEHKEYWTLDPKLPDGKDKVRYRAEEAIAGTKSLETEGTATVKVDTVAPYRISLQGLPFGNELSERAYELTAYATDGEGTSIASSGVKSIALFVDGRERVEVGKQTGCSVTEGECTASAKWSINGAELGSGHHAIVIEAFDHAGNEARHYETITVRHSTPVALGPGFVDLQSGDFSLGATDVSMGSGLTVGRDYSSRAPGSGAEGPLGPQWNLNTGTAESLSEMVDGSILLTDASGKQTIFALLENGEFEPPTGDSNLKLRLEENKETKQKLAYYLENTTDHTKTKFTLPTGGTREWVPTIEEGSVGSDMVTYTYRTAEGQSEYAVGKTPWDITSGPGGDLWYTNREAGTIASVTTAGEQTSYFAPEGQKPAGITQGSDGNLWFVNTKGTVDKMTSRGVFTSYAVTGAGGTFEHIAEGSDGNVWFTHSGGTGAPGTIAKMTTAGVATNYNAPVESNPNEIVAGPEGDLWFLNQWCEHNGFESVCKIGKITTSGIITEYALEKGLTPEAITAGPNGEQAVWFMAVGSNNTAYVAKMTATGAMTKYQLPITGNIRPEGITVGPDNNLWFTEKGESKIGKMTLTGTFSEYHIAANSEPYGIVAGPDGKLWFTETGTSSKIGTMPVSGTITEPVEILAPVPANVSCAPMKAGCRALKFVYATATTAIGNPSSQWGEYKGRLKQVRLDAYNPQSKLMEEPAVAEYSYDGLGRLRAAWDPRLSTPLKTTYGYDEEGHVTALNPPGAQPYTFTYGTTANDAGEGRLLKAMRPPASEALWGGERVTNTALPVISGPSTPTVGERITVSNGTWSGKPLTYGYQWERCASAGSCTIILGATNPNYTPSLSDIGDTLVALVSATNGDGSVVATSAATSAVVTYYYTQTVDGGNSISGISCIASTTDCAVVDNLGKAFYSTNVSATATAKWTSWKGPGPAPSEAVGCPATSLCLMAAGTDTSRAGGNEYAATALGEGWSQVYTPVSVEFGGDGVDAISCASTTLCVAGRDGSGFFAYSTKPGTSSWVGEKQGTAAMKGVSCLASGSFCAMADNTGTVHVATTAAQIESSAWTLTDVNGTTALNSISCISTTECVAVDGVGDALKLTVNTKGEVTTAKQDIDGSNSLTGVSCLELPMCVAVDNVGNIFVTTNSGGTWTKSYIHGNAWSSVSCALGSTCVAADTNGIVTTFNWAHITSTEVEAKAPQPGMTLDYNVPVGGAEAPYQLGKNATTHKPEPERWGQSDDPLESTAIFPEDSPQGWPAGSYTRATVYYLDEQGRNVNVASPSTSEYGTISTTEYDEETNDVTRTLSPDNRIKSLEAGAESAKVAKTLDTEYFYNQPECRKESPFKEKEIAEYGTRLCETWGPEHLIKYTPNGFKETREAMARDHIKYFYEDIAHGAPEVVKEEEKQLTKAYDLVTETTDIARLANEEEVEVRKSTTSYSGQNGLGWKLRAPTSTTADAEGKKLTHTTLYNENTAQVVETRGPAGGAGKSAHDAKIVYYSAEAKPEEYETTEEYEICGHHPEWAGLVCETRPAVQSTVKMAVTITRAYNIWNEPETVEEVFGTAKRVKKETYDEAGRLVTSETTATENGKESVDKSLPKVTDKYNSSTGVLETQSTTVSEKTQTVTSKYSTLGQLVEYTDADGNVAKYAYGGPENDGLLEEATDGSGEGKGRQTYAYNPTTKLLEKLWDSSAGIFTATYDPEGRMTSEVYPNAMCANYTHNSVGETTHMEYIKTSNCAEANPTVWFSETTTSSIRGEMRSRTNTLGSENYSYDTAGRLVETQETPAGEGCKVRAYAYDEESNRTSLTTRLPGTKNECLTEGGTVESHTYDEGNHLIDAGIEYDSFGNVKKLPAADAEGHELTSTFYVDGAVASQSQNGVTNEYQLDPIGRVRATASGGKTTISHYDGGGETPSWTIESGGTNPIRNIAGIDGTLAAVETNGTKPVLQLHDLEGNVVATASLSTEATKLESTYNSTEFGVPNGKTPPKYAWLGAQGIATSLSSGVITYGATSYVPQTGLALQSEQVGPPGAPGGSGVGAPYESKEEPWMMQGAAAEGAEAPGREAARQREAEEAACRANPSACSEDPAWSGNVSIGVAESLGGILEGMEFAYALGGNVVVDLVKTLAEQIHVNWISQVKQAIEQGVFGYSMDDVAKWAFTVGSELGDCATILVKKHKRKGHCWLYFPTVVRRTRRGGPGMEFPDFGAEIGWDNPHRIAVGFCPGGAYSKCFNVIEHEEVEERLI